MSGRAPVWKTKNPKAKSGQSRRLTSSQKAAAKQRAAKAGRKYPNLVDNIRAARLSEAKKVPRT
ncbi:hypothetical protein Hden_0343 [Hyphomicrobium denitrificans ATCC 51888]|uniref:Uncharacterized protein n=1 Tax=Hyphomicrobium denitrificans (strain ATCC 51888 / DSM 1869 / NCIMB 11706 / TK 0415) TaxID=582899 RepID=D8JRD9_HYPDA|nr:hypothetical protein [Hyphomicrobium denitrificans]ADJ22168.1 hypothetical protein Hden_0343 [Hyphomicrobium denitrificans ATCC 51888]